jgi:hypothetical protein
MEYTPEELKRAFELYYDLRISSRGLKLLYLHSPLKGEVIKSATDALSSFRKGVPSSIVDLFSNELEEIEGKIESASKPSPFARKIEPAERGRLVLTGDLHACFAYE